MIGASPLIRIRLGDLIRSNYSRFALARLFGAGTDEMKLEGDLKFSGAGANLDAIRDKIKKTVTDPKIGSTYTLAAPGGAAVAPGASLSLPIVSGPSTPANALVMNIDGGDLKYFEFKIVSTNTTKGSCVVEPKLVSNEDLMNVFGLSSDTVTSVSKTINAKYSNKAKNVNQCVLGGQYNVAMSQLRPTFRTFQAILNEANIQGIDNIDKLNDFLNSEKNALVKSFKSIQGKGLGGVIESMSFDWYDKATWETSFGNIAPKMCKVTIGFAPIHDISPGLDHQGANRAPIYPVGAGMKHGFDPER
jgi:hypothetical protein